MGVVEVGARIPDDRSDGVVEVFEGCNRPLGDLGGSIGEDIETFGEAVPVLWILVSGNLCVG